MYGVVLAANSSQLIQPLAEGQRLLLSDRAHSAVTTGTVSLLSTLKSWHPLVTELV
jgi:hypothetical protein